LEVQDMAGLFLVFAVACIGSMLAKTLRNSVCPAFDPENEDADGESWQHDLKVLRTRADTNEDTVASLMTMLNEMRVHSGMKEYTLPQESKIVVEDSVTGLMPSPQSTPALCSARVVAAFFRVDPSGDDYDYNGTALLQLVTDWQVQVKKTTSNVAVDDHLIVTLLQKVDAAGPADTPTALQRQIIQQFLLLHPTLLSDYFERYAACSGDGVIGTMEDLKQLSTNLLFALKSLNLITAAEASPAVIGEVEQTVLMVQDPVCWGLSEFTPWFENTVMKIVFP